MPIIASDFGRRFILDVCAAGSVSIRKRGQPMQEGLPCFTVDTYAEAEALQSRHCRRANDGSGLYHLNDRPEQDTDASEYLGRVADLFRKSYETIQKPAKVTA